jgi:hypothetical protein
MRLLISFSSGLSWNTDDNSLRQRFEEFGVVEDAVSHFLLPLISLFETFLP